VPTVLFCFATDIYLNLIIGTYIYILYIYRPKINYIKIIYIYI